MHARSIWTYSNVYKTEQIKYGTSTQKRIMRRVNSFINFFGGGAIFHARKEKEKETKRGKKT